jgi:hypothetical protein
MNPRPKTKLSLSTETLRTLSASELAHVDGGFTNVSDSCACNSFICSIGSNCPTVACPKGGGGGW